MAEKGNVVANALSWLDIGAKQITKGPRKEMRWLTFLVKPRGFALRYKGGVPQQGVALGRYEDIPASL